MNAQTTSAVSGSRWSLAVEGGITWDVRMDPRGLHRDRLEMSGRQISAVIHFGVKENGRLIIERELIWPRLRLVPNDTYGSLGRFFDDLYRPTFLVNNRPQANERLLQVDFDGLLRLRTEPAPGLEIVRTIFPSTTHGALIENYVAINRARRAFSLKANFPTYNEITDPSAGVYGAYRVKAWLDRTKTCVIEAGESTRFSIFWTADLARKSLGRLDGAKEEQARRRFVKGLGRTLQLKTPEPGLDQMFSFSKIRAAESIFSTRGGPLHSPGGGLKERKPKGRGRYYAAIWANDQAEYACPLFPYLGYELGNQAALNVYRHFARHMNPGYHPLPSSIIAEGTDIWSDAGDRGDAAMIAYGAGRFALARGDRGIAEELWPLIAWCLEYCARRTNQAGVVSSDSDELEGRIPSGAANLHTSVLTYDALLSASFLAAALKRNARVGLDYQARGEQLRGAIEKYFGGTVEGFETYRYFEGNTDLRAWICSTLSAGIFERKSATISALLSPRLWTKNGLLTTSSKRHCWDRSTLYALRGMFHADEAEKALASLLTYSHHRLLGDHVPYAVESDSEGEQSHLAGESALYARIYTEGLFGLRPTGLQSFTWKPALPSAWDRMSLHRIRAHGETFDLRVARSSRELEVSVRRFGGRLLTSVLRIGESMHVDLSTIEDV